MVVCTVIHARITPIRTVAGLHHFVILYSSDALSSVSLWHHSDWRVFVSKWINTYIAAASFQWCNLHYCPSYTHVVCQLTMFCAIFLLYIFAIMNFSSFSCLCHGLIRIAEVNAGSSLEINHFLVLKKNEIFANVIAFVWSVWVLFIWISTQRVDFVCSKKNGRRT